MHKCNRNIDDVKRDIAAFFEQQKRANKPQSIAATEIGVDQGTISRYKNGRFSRLSTVADLCSYAKIPLQEEIEPDEEWQNKLTAAVLDAWDGSVDHARKLEKVIQIVGNVTKRA